MRLLPDHSAAVPPALWWLDLCGHLTRTWRHVQVAETTWLGAGADGWLTPDLEEKIAEWERSDALLLGLRELQNSSHQSNER